MRRASFKGYGADQSYISNSEVIRVAKLSRADAIQRSYGLLTESPKFEAGRQIDARDLLIVYGDRCEIALCYST